MTFCIRNNLSALCGVLEMKDLSVAFNLCPLERVKIPVRYNTASLYQFLDSVEFAVTNKNMRQDAVK